MIRERTRAELDAARARGRVGGRPRSFTDKDLEIAKTLLANPDITVDQGVARLRVAPPPFTATCQMVEEASVR